MEMVEHKNFQKPETRTEKEQEIFDALRVVQDPEIYKSIVDLGLVYGVHCNEDNSEATVCMTLTSPMCPFGPVIVKEVEDIVSTAEGIKDSKVEIVWEPAWDPKTMASDEIKMELGIW